MLPLATGGYWDGWARWAGPNYKIHSTCTKRQPKWEQGQDFEAYHLAFLLYYYYLAFLLYYYYLASSEVKVLTTTNVCQMLSIVRMLTFRLLNKNNTYALHRYSIYNNEDKAATHIKVTYLASSAPPPE